MILRIFVRTPAETRATAMLRTDLAVRSPNQSRMERINRAEGGRENQE